MSQFAESLKKLRSEANLSMQALAEKAGVSKSTICKIERDEVQPTIDVAARLATALGKTLSEFLHSDKHTHTAFLPRKEQAIWEDASGVKRRNITPIFEGLKLEWLEVELPAATTIQAFTPLHPHGSAKYILVKKGQLKMTINEQVFILEEGDSLYFDASVKHEFRNDTDDTTQYYVVIKHEG